MQCYRRGCSASCWLAAVLLCVVQPYTCHAESPPGEDFGLPAQVALELSACDAAGWTGLSAEQFTMLSQGLVGSSYNHLVGDRSPTTAYVGLSIASLVNVQQKVETFRLKGALYSIHVDCRLRSPNATQEYVKLSGRSTLQKLFIPDLQLVNQVAFDEQEGPDVECRVHRRGYVACTRFFLGAFATSFNFKKMPWDSHQLPVIVQSRDDTSTQLLEWMHPSDPIETWDVDQLSLAGWDIALNSSVEAGTRLYRTLHKRVARLTARIRITRYAYDYQMNAILPCVMYWFLSYLGFWLPKDAVPARAATGVIPVLMLLNLSIRVSDELPPAVDYVPWMSEFILVTTVLSVLNFTAYTISMWAKTFLLQFEAKYAGIISKKDGGFPIADRKKKEGPEAMHPVSPTASTPPSGARRFWPSSLPPLKLRGSNQVSAVSGTSSDQQPSRGDPVTESLEEGLPRAEPGSSGGSPLERSRGPPEDIANPVIADGGSGGPEHHASPAHLGFKAVATMATAATAMSNAAASTAANALGNTWNQAYTATSDGALGVTNTLNARLRRGSVRLRDTHKVIKLLHHLDAYLSFASLFLYFLYSVVSYFRL